MQGFTAEQNQYLVGFIDQLKKIQDFFSRLVRFEHFRKTDNSEIRQVANTLSTRVASFEWFERRSKNFEKKGEFSGFLSGSCEELSDAIKALKKYYDIKIKQLRDIYLIYEEGDLNFNIQTLLTTVKEVKTSLNDFIEHNYFIKELQHEVDFKSESAVSTKTQLIKASACAEILELELIQSKKPTDAEIQKVFDSFNLAVNGLEAKCAKTSESLNQLANNWLKYKEVFALAENKSVQTEARGFFGKFFNYFRPIQQLSPSHAAQVSAEEAKEREIRFTMLRK